MLSVWLQNFKTKVSHHFTGVQEVIFLLKIYYFKLTSILVAVNCMWPKTAIWTAAMEMLGGDDSAKKSRTPQIMADTAYSILCQPTSFSGNFIIDDEYLEKHHNIKDFSVSLPIYFCPFTPNPFTVAIFTLYLFRVIKLIHQFHLKNSHWISFCHLTLQMKSNSKKATTISLVPLVVNLKLNLLFRKLPKKCQV